MTSSVLSRRPIAPPRVATLAALGLAALLVGCASPGPAHPPLKAVAAPALGLTAAESAPVAPQWWRSLGDERLSALVEQALQDQPSLAVARARMQRVAALAQLTRAATGPQAALTAQASRQLYSANGLLPPPLGGRFWNEGTVQAGASWSPDFFGEHAAELASAVGQARAAQADAAAAANALAAQVSRGYIGLARLIAQRQVLEQTRSQREAMLKLTRERVSAGLDTRVELTQAEGGLPEIATQVEALDEQITLARRQLAVLSGQAPDALSGLSPRLASLQLASMPDTLGADLLGRRPDVVAARWRVEAATQDVSSAHAQFYPNINLSAFIGLDALNLAHVFRSASREMGVLPALHLPLFDGGRLRAQLGGRQAELDAAIAQYNGVVLGAVKEAGDAVSSAQSLERQQREQAAAMAHAESAQALAAKRYQAGLGSYLIVLGSESQVLAQRRLAVDLQARRLDTRVALLQALGGGWTDDTPALGLAQH